MNTRIVELDISKEGVGTVVKLAQGDIGGTTIKALVYDNGSEFNLDDAAVYFVALLPDKRHYYRGGCEVSGNTATHVVNEEKLCSVSGYTDEAYLEIELSGQKFSTERFALDIFRSALDGQQPAENWDNAVEDLIDLGTQAQEEFARAESARKEAEYARNEAEAKRVAAEKQRSESEITRSEAEGSRVSAEDSRSSAEALRAQAEALRAQAEELRAQAESARAAAESARQSAETLRIAAEQQRETDQAKNNADQAANNAAAQGLQVVILTDGQFDADSGEPIIEGEAGKLYFVPEQASPIGAHAATVDAGDNYVEWMWINNTWERVGMSEATIVPISTDEIDAVVESGSGTGEQVLNLTGLSYYWTKVKAWAQSVFAKVAHTHQASDITGFTPSRAVVSNSAGDLDASTVTTSELECLSGAESPLQDQIDTLRDSVSHGVQEFTDIRSGTYQGRRIEFGRTYNLSPTIVGTIIGGSGVVTTAVNCSLQFALIDSSGATVYLYNGSTQNISKLWIHWIAIAG